MVEKFVPINLKTVASCDHTLLLLLQNVAATAVLAIACLALSTSH